MRINHNIAALNTHRQLGSAQNAQQKSMEKLSSGLRINNAADDAAGLAISEKMRGQIRGLDQATANAQDSISLVQTAEGALNETHDILQRMRELATQSANDTNTNEDRTEIQKEVDQLSQELTRIADNTEFNTQNLLDGSFKGTFHIGANEGQNIELSVNNMSASALKVSGNEGAGFEVTATATPGTAAFANDTSYEVVELKENAQVKDAAGTGTLSVKYGMKDSAGDIVAVSADGKDFKTLASGVAVDNLSTGQVNADDTSESYTFADEVTNGETSIDGAGVMTATATVETTLANDTYTTATATESALVTGANTGLLNSAGELVAVSSDGLSWKAANDLTGADVLTTTTDLSAAGESITVSGSGLNVSTQEAADKAITVINDAIQSVSGERSKLGAIQNRLDHTINNLGTSSENLTAAESRIRDVDYDLAAA